ncbi:hypothetical protein [Nocardia cyriacigeorgica]|uniref:hypothetical protein n=1 Tax=Nocardia cyriacigeorgica TaxID=135487 RepID=UPI0013EF5606|nr:hypothetical protein [Nocardia cyriacigeorgica]MBF6158679.1 hypothetical protein [Nocardia cyriacigeorgica]MBF6316499.1 hypothetical protein [Nocardia cyriacigeorgica]MBF6344965.1 hypothetical protein [Nocardia cyriacigeorgica]MBF6534816.1 hypothetical protein [Nocardia cyriacigeorgica]
MPGSISSFTDAHRKGQPVRHIATVCAVAGTLILTAAGPASGAEGFLVINGTEHENPSGCVEVQQEPAPFRIINDTGSVAVAYLGAGCTNSVTEEVEPGMEVVVFGSSVQIE